MKDKGMLKQLDYFKAHGFEAYVWTYEGYQAKWESLFGHLKRQKDPEFHQVFSIAQFGTKVYPQTIEQLEQLIKDSSN